MNKRFKYLNKLDIELSTKDRISFKKSFVDKFGNLKSSNKIDYIYNDTPNFVEIILFNNTNDLDWINNLSIDANIDNIILTHLPYSNEVKDDLKIIKYWNGGIIDSYVCDFGSDEFNELMINFFSINNYKIPYEMFGLDERHQIMKI